VPAADPAKRVVNLPNALSLLRLLLVPVFGWLLATDQDGWALLVLVVSGWTDFFDGYLARRWNQMTRIGQLLDPLADRLYILAALFGLGWREIVPWWLVALIVSRDLILAWALPVLAKYDYGPLPVHKLGKAATFNILSAFPFLLLGDTDGAVGDVARAGGWAFAIWGTALYWWAGLLYLEQARRLVVEARAQARAS
jgi:cardiolipin synthase (CMP-forming)